ncbi:hypothetical protein NDU88_011084 [Pleurodeles waltl]|uniref:Uncharacterized protein n=1 Tax=Pleurodeles waltl TaxID=8319 RepID=A0AAV7Q228_PLEWA|nr:hypothetical protein NDU88_011084 [Pleurodeles waltl]
MKLRAPWLTSSGADRRPTGNGTFLGDSPKAVAVLQGESVLKEVASLSLRRRCRERVRWERWPEERGAETVKARAVRPAVQIGGRMVTASSCVTTLGLWQCCRERMHWKRWPEERGVEMVKARVMRPAVQIGGRLIMASSCETALRLRR